jgi:hypothetical protein
MKSEKRSKSWAVALITVSAMVGSAGPASTETSRTPVNQSLRQLRTTEWRVMDVLAQVYGKTDFSLVTAAMVEDAGYAGNPNIVFIPLSLANVYLNRYEWRNHIADRESSIQWLEWVVDNHRLWGERWLSAPVVSYLDLSVRRLGCHSVHADFGPRIARLQEQALRITQEEADARLTDGFPYQPYDSSATGDSKAEENAWEASLLAAAANFLPEHDHARAWEEKARQLAYNAITRPSDLPDGRGIKTATVAEDLTLANHGFSPNPTYTAATILLLQQGALAYRLTGREVPPEFQHNVRELYGVYKRYVDGDLAWTIPADPAGDAALFPFAFDSELERKAAKLRAASGKLWVATSPVDTMNVGDPLWAAVLNSKAVYFYMVGSYLWHFPPAAPDTTPDDGKAR